MDAKVASLDPPFCNGGGRHIKPGDLYIRVPIHQEYREFDNYCFICILDLRDYKTKKICEKANANIDLMHKRASILDKSSKIRKQVLGLVMQRWPRIEIEKALDQIQHDCFEEIWSQRLNNLCLELNKPNPFIDSLESKQKKKRVKSINVKNKKSK